MSEPWDIDPPNEAGKLRIENACCHEEIKRQAAEIARLSRDWDTVREAHDNLVCELDLRLTERRQQAAEIERLRAALRFWCEAYKSGQHEPLVAAYESTVRDFPALENK